MAVSSASRAPRTLTLTPTPALTLTPTLTLTLTPTLTPTLAPTLTLTLTLTRSSTGATETPEAQARQWVAEVTRHDAGGASLQAWLRSGIVLCELANAIEPSCAARSVAAFNPHANPHLDSNPTPNPHLDPNPNPYPNPNPNPNRRPSASAMPFKQMENINSYTDACRRLGVPEADLFDTVDLLDP